MTGPLPQPPADLALGRMRSQRVADWLASAAADLPPGERLGGKEDLRAQVGVSMATMNEALRILQARGAVSVRPGPGGGVFVARPHPLVRISEALVAVTGDPKAIADAIALRDALDPLCVLEAARYRTEQDIADLRARLADMRSHIDDDLQFKRSIWEFHRRLVQICRNDILRAVSLGLLELLGTRTNGTVPGSDTKAHRQRRLQVHEAIADAIASADEQQCAQASRDHALDTELPDTR